MIFVLGGATYGLARLFRGAWWVSSGWGWAHGNGGAPPSRPDIPRVGRRGMALPSLRENRLGSAPFVKLAGAVLLLVGLLVVVDQAEDFFDIERLDQESTEELLDETETQSSQGGSEFENERWSIVDFPLATGTILFRPYLWEASGTGQLLTALEGAVLLALIIHARHELIRPARGVPRALPHVCWCSRSRSSSDSRAWRTSGSSSASGPSSSPSSSCSCR